MRGLLAMLVDIAAFCILDWRWRSNNNKMKINDSTNMLEMSLRDEISQFQATS